MKQIALVVFDDFTDIDLFLSWDILGRNQRDWQVRLLGTRPEHRSAHGLRVPVHGPLAEAAGADAVLVCSGRLGVPAFLADEVSVHALAQALDPSRQLIGSVCAGALILARLGLLGDGPATTHPQAQPALAAAGIQVVDRPLVCRGRVATAGGCLSALYLTGWLIETMFGRPQRQQALRELLPAGQQAEFERLIDAAIGAATSAAISAATSAATSSSTRAAIGAASAHQPTAVTAPAPPPAPGR
jgi:transcriptional regulator GlxA family with amidase domain